MKAGETEVVRGIVGKRANLRRGPIFRGQPARVGCGAPGSRGDVMPLYMDVSQPSGGNHDTGDQVTRRPDLDEQGKYGGEYLKYG